MEVQLEEMVRKIKSAGVDQAKKEADEILAKAQADAKRIVSEAQAEAKASLDKAQAEAKQWRQTVEDSLRQTARDLVLSTRKELEALFHKLLKEDVQKSMSGEKLEALILEILKTWTAAKDVNIELSPEDAKLLGGHLTEKLKSMMSNSQFEIKPLEGMSAGLRISFRDGTAYFDFTDEEISKALMQLLNPKFASLLA